MAALSYGGPSPDKCTMDQEL